MSHSILLYFVVYAMSKTILHNVSLHKVTVPVYLFQFAVIFPTPFIRYQIQIHFVRFALVCVRLYSANLKVYSTIFALPSRCTATIRQHIFILESGFVGAFSKFGWALAGRSLNHAWFSRFHLGVVYINQNRFLMFKHRNLCAVSYILFKFFCSHSHVGFSLFAMFLWYIAATCTQIWFCPQTHTYRPNRIKSGYGCNYHLKFVWNFVSRASFH